VWLLVRFTHKGKDASLGVLPFYFRLTGDSQTAGYDDSELTSDFLSGRQE
jgi:hypothetical protein